MARKLRSLAQWVRSPCNRAEFIQTTCFTIRRSSFPVCTRPQVLGHISEMNDHDLNQLPSQAQFGTQIGNIEATYEESVAPAHRMIGKKQVSPHEEVRIVESASGGMGV